MNIRRSGKLGFRGHRSVICRLLGAEPVNIERADRWERKPPHWAMALSHIDIIELLLKCGSDADRKEPNRTDDIENWKAVAT